MTEFLDNLKAISEIQDDLDPAKVLDLQIAAIIKEYGRAMIERNAQCPCCGLMIPPS